MTAGELLFGEFGANGSTSSTSPIIFVTSRKCKQYPNKGKNMNKQTVKGDKNSKWCKGCKSRIRPMVAGNETCDMFEKREDAKPYQLFLRVQDSRLLPEIVARPAGDESYPADHVKMCGLTVTSPNDGWDVARAICNAVENGQGAVRRDEIGQAVLDACNMLRDVCTLNESLSSKSAVELVTGAKRIMEQVAERLQLPLDYE